MDVYIGGKMCRHRARVFDRRKTRAALSAWEKVHPGVKYELVDAGTALYIYWV